MSALLAYGEELWVGLGSELHRYEREKEGWSWAEAVKATGRVNRLMADPQGNVWVATESRGVGKISALRRAVRRADPPCATQVYSITEAADGSLLVAGDACSWRARSGDLATLEVFGALSNTKVWHLREGRGGRLWAAGEQGLLVASDGAWRGVELGDEGASIPTRCLLERGEEIYVGTVRGLFRVAPDLTVQKVDAPFGYVYTLRENPEGRLLVGTIGNGLWLEQEDGSFAPFGGELVGQLGNVYSVALSADGRAAVIGDDRIVLVEQEPGDGARDGDHGCGGRLEQPLRRHRATLGRRLLGPGEIRPGRAQAASAAYRDRRPERRRVHGQQLPLVQRRAALRRIGWRLEPGRSRGARAALEAAGGPLAAASLGEHRAPGRSVARGARPRRDRALRQLGARGARRRSVVLG